MGRSELRAWREGWVEQLQGRNCVLCGLIGVSENSWGVRVFTGRYIDAYLPRSGSVVGYTVAVWNGRHLSEPTQLNNEEAAGYWREMIEVGRAVEQTFQHAKMNYQMLGNSVPHLHTHIVPRPLLDPAPGEPLPWRYLDEGRQDEQSFASAVSELSGVLT